MVEVFLYYLAELVIFLVETFDRIMDAVSGAGVYLAAFFIFVSIRMILGPLLGKAIDRGSDSAANKFD